MNKEQGIKTESRKVRKTDVRRYGVQVESQKDGKSVSPEDRVRCPKMVLKKKVGKSRRRATKNEKRLMEDAKRYPPCYLTTKYLDGTPKDVQRTTKNVKKNEQRTTKDAKHCLTTNY